MTYQTINPATGAAVKTFPNISNADLDRAVTKAHEVYLKDWSRRSIKERAKIVSAAAAKLREKADEYAGYITLEMGKLLGVSQAEVQLSAAILDYYAQNAEEFMKPQDVPGVPGAVLETHPIGVVLGIEPWNFPYYQIARVAGPQLMAGNTLIIKHAENVPQCALAFARLFEEAGAPEGAYTNVFATIEQIGLVIDDPRVRGVTVTGSERAGAAVAERAGRALKKTVMELGGSDPFIVLEDAPMEDALDKALFGRMFNTGQSCVGSKRIIVVGKERGKQFVEGYTARMASLKAGDPTDGNTTLGPVCSERAMNTLLDQINAARKGGAKVLTGGGRVDRPGFYVEATVITNISPSNPVYKQELFGPVASLYVVDSEAEAVELANDSPYGLGAVVFSADMERGRRIAQQIESGMVWVNQPPWTGPELPFGGVKNSGFGRELAEIGFGEFVNRKMISVVPNGSPPWGPVSG